MYLVVVHLFYYHLLEVKWDMSPLLVVWSRVAEFFTIRKYHSFTVSDYYTIIIIISYNYPYKEMNSYIFK